MQMYSENYFDSSACRDEFEHTVTEQVPDIADPCRIVIPLVVRSCHASDKRKTDVLTCQVSKLSFKYPTSDPFLVANRNDPQLGQFCELALTELGQRNCFPNPAGKLCFWCCSKHTTLMCSVADGPFMGDPFGTPFMGDGATRSFKENMHQLVNILRVYVDQWHTGVPAVCARLPVINR